MYENMSRRLEAAILDTEFRRSDVRFGIGAPKNLLVRVFAILRLKVCRVMGRYLETAILDAEFRKSDVKFIISAPRNLLFRIFTTKDVQGREPPS